MSKKSETMILVVDDSVETTELIKRNLESKGHRVVTADNVQSAIKLLEALPIDMVVTDLKMPGESGMTLVRHVSENYNHIGVLVVTGFPSIQGAVESIKIGAEEYLVKSFTDKELFEAVDRVLAKKPLRKKRQIKESDSFGIVGSSEVMQKVFNTIAKVKDTKATVLIMGESGTGKELVARAIHYSGMGSKAPFVPVNCGGIPDALLESELFGFVKGSFTGAIDSRAGFFQTADGGTIFLDEISNTSLAMQAKLLRVLQEKEFYMIGSKKPQRVNVRIVAASNTDLLQMVKKGTFREDLYYRLNIITIELPSLHQRGGDIPLLLEHFNIKYSRENEKTPLRITPRAIEAMQSYRWPGNVRELQNFVHRAVILSEEGVLDVPDLPESFRYSAVRTGSLNRSLQEVEFDYIMDVLAANGENLSHAAKILGIDRKTLRSKINKSK